MPLLIVEYPGPRRGAKMPPRVLIGRRSMNHLVVDHSDVSRMHAWIDRVGGEFVITDMRSRTATTVNGRVLPRSRALVDGDVIAIGPAKLTFLAGDELPPGVEPFEIPAQPVISRRDVGVRFDCPHCRAPMWAAPQFAMHLGSCVYCGEEFVVPTGPAGPDGLAVAATVPPPAVGTTATGVATSAAAAPTISAPAIAAPTTTPATSTTATAPVGVAATALTASADAGANLAGIPSTSPTLSGPASGSAPSSSLTTSSVAAGSAALTAPLLPPLDPLPPLFPPQLPEDAAAIVTPAVAARLDLPPTAPDAPPARDASSPTPKIGDGPIAPELLTDGLPPTEPTLRLVGEWSAGDGPTAPTSSQASGRGTAETADTPSAPAWHGRPAHDAPSGGQIGRQRPESSPTADTSQGRDAHATGIRARSASAAPTRPARPSPPAPGTPAAAAVSAPAAKPASAATSISAAAAKAAPPMAAGGKTPAATPTNVAKPSPAIGPRRPGGVQVKPDAGTLAAAEGFNRVSPAPGPTGTTTARGGSSSRPDRPAGVVVAEAPSPAHAPASRPLPAPGVPDAQSVAGTALPIDFGTRGDRPAIPAVPPTGGRADPGGNGHAKSPPVGRRVDDEPAAESPTTTAALAEPPAVAEPIAPAPAALAPAVVASPPGRPPAPPDVAAAPKLRCGVCQSTIEPNEARATCPSCGLLFHEECWQENYGCSAYGCSQVNALAPQEPDAGGDGATVDESAATDGDLSDVPPPPRKPWEFVLLGVSVLAAIAGAFTFGGAALAALAAAVVCLIRTRRDDDRRTSVVVAAAALSAAAAAAGATTSYFLFLYGRR